MLTMLLGASTAFSCAVKPHTFANGMLTQLPMLKEICDENYQDFIQSLKGGNMLWGELYQLDINLANTAEIADKFDEQLENQGFYPIANSNENPTGNQVVVVYTNMNRSKAIFMNYLFMDADANDPNSVEAVYIAVAGNWKTLSKN